MSAGTLPSDWSVVSVLDASERIMDYRGRTPKKLGMDWGGGDIPAISARNVRMGHIDFREEFYLASEALYRRWMTHGDMQAGDIIVTTEAPLGNVAAVPDDRRYVLSQRTVLIRPKTGLFNKTYFLKALQSPAFQRLLVENATGSTALGIQRKRLEQLPVVAPPLPEQLCIAEALQTADDLLDVMEREIAKKQAIKQGMMQELLTGRTRLCGFSGEWTEVALGEVSTVTMGQSPPSYSYNGDGRGLPLIQGNADIRERRAIERIWTTQPAKRCRAGDVILTVRAPVGYTAVAGRDSCLGRGVCAVSAHKDNRYIYHALVQAESRWVVFEQGSTFTAVNSQQVRTFTIPWPVDALERGAIAEAIDDADFELRALAEQLQKTNAIKQGMMQELLTGRTRLPVETPS
ncbi:MAG: restriction endonuclease subunit S [Actinomycetia bacterium]|nr:restriction endonuclease subunit S [Actinomycetes bacterium]